MFNAGQFVIKPNTGICVIDEIVRLDLMGDGAIKDYYLLRPINDRRSTLYVSIDADRARLRLAMSESEALEFIKSIPSVNEAEITNEKFREQTYKDAFRSNEAIELVSILKNMYSRSQQRLASGKKITATDEKYSQQAEKILYSELSFALGCEISQVKEKIVEITGISLS